ncbi:MAG: hypothetical protein R3E01_34090 [Pirellulaceae bacterium]|nr:hypothetical protein [Planctomycetales bacterium]
MPFGRQKFLILGMTLIFLGVQLRFVESFVLTPKASQFVETKMQNSGLMQGSRLDAYLPRTSIIAARKTVTPPRWIGLALISVGAVLVLHGVTLDKD